MLTQTPGSVYQIAYLVPSLETAAREWAELTGAGPFYLFEHFEFIQPIYKGDPAEVDISIAMGFSAGVCVELIYQHDERPSIYQDWLAEHGHGLHHVAKLATDFPAALENHQAKGAPVVFTGAFGGGTRLAYLDARATLGCYLELVEFDDFVNQALNAMRDAHASWDGQDPLRPFAL